MGDTEFTDNELLSYLDELLPADQMAVAESALRGSEPLRNRLGALSRQRDSGVHSVGEIWRRMRLSCPTRSQLGSYLLDALENEMRQYIDFHLKTVGCRICVANLDDLEQAMKSKPEAERRRQRYFQSSAGYLSQISDRDE